MIYNINDDDPPELEKESLTFNSFRLYKKTPSYLISPYIICGKCKGHVSNEPFLSFQSTQVKGQLCLECFKNYDLSIKSILKLIYIRYGWYGFKYLTRYQEGLGEDLDSLNTIRKAKKIFKKYEKDVTLYML